jgi:hypothetical protein
MTPNCSVVGLLEVTVVEPISNVVLVVAEYTQRVTAGLSIGQ